MDLSIIIVNWNSRELLRKCLVSIRANPPSCSYETIVVDAASYDGAREMISHGFPWVNFIQCQHNLGFGRCNNLAARSAAGRLLLLLNPDTEVRPNALDRLHHATTASERIGLAGPRLLNSNGTLQTGSVRSAPTPLNRALDSNLLRRYAPQSRLWGTWAAFHSHEPVVVEAVSGACMLVRAEVFRQVGGFNPIFFMYAEDMDLCLQIRRLGYCILHVPSAEVTHHGGGSSRTQASQFATVIMRDSAQTYMRINHGRLCALRYRLLQGLSAALRVVLLLGVVCSPWREHRAMARVAILKWWYVLLWSVGCASLSAQEAGRVAVSSQVSSVDSVTLRPASSYNGNAAPVDRA